MDISDLVVNYWKPIIVFGAGAVTLSYGAGEIVARICDRYSGRNNNEKFHIEFHEEYGKPDGVEQRRLR